MVVLNPSGRDGSASDLESSRGLGYTSCSEVLARRGVRNLSFQMKW